MQTINIKDVGGVRGFEKFARKHPGVVFTWDSGNGWTSEGVYEPALRRVRYVAISPSGFRVV